MALTQPHRPWKLLNFQHTSNRMHRDFILTDNETYWETEIATVAKEGGRGKYLRRMRNKKRSEENQ